MQLKYKGNVNTWGIVAISLHWILAVLLFFQFGGVTLNACGPVGFSSSPNAMAIFTATLSQGFCW